MGSVIHTVLLLTQYFALAVLFGEILYIALLKPSKFQVQMLFLLISTFVMLFGYSVELYATTVENALSGAAISYLGKPFALLMTLVFIAEYSGKPLSKAIIVSLAILGMCFPLIIFTNGCEPGTGHHLYYATVAFDEGRSFSPLILTRGPLYFAYMAYLIAIFCATMTYLVLEIIKAKTKESRTQLSYLFGMMTVTIAGYVLYLSGVTYGYDTTMTGAALGSMCLTLVFFRYKLFDSLTLAKEHALTNASTGLLVLNDRDQAVYTNQRIDAWLKDTFSMQEFTQMPDGMEVVKRGEQVFEVQKASIEKRGVSYGKTIEITDITEKYNYNSQLEHDVEERTKEIRTIQRSVITSFASIIEARDDSTGTHIKRMSCFVEIIAREMLAHGDYPEILNEEYITCLVDVSPLHDIGKLTIPDSVLCKPGKLTAEEFEVMKTHTSAGARVINECLDGVERPGYVEMARHVATSHHEKWNGAGYPARLEAQDIPLCARIVAVADVYDALRSERCYKPMMSKEEARIIIEEGRGNHFDPLVVDAFLRALPQIECV